MINRDLKLYEATFNSEDFSEANHLSKALQTEADWLSPIVTHLYGGNSQYSSFNFPVLWKTEGMQNIKLIESVDGEYKVPVMGRPKKTSTVNKTSYDANSRAGRGYGVIVLGFADNWFYQGQSVLSPSKKECQVLSVKKDISGKGYRVELQMYTNKGEDYLPFKDTQVGATWGQGVRKVSLSRSRGGKHRSYNPYAVKNQISMVRDTMNFAGNVKNKVMVVEIQVDGKSIKYWTQWEMYFNDLQFMEACENDLFYSQYNKDENGVIHNTDLDSGEVVPSGAGILQQIDNEDSYSILTEKKIKGFIRDVYYNTSQQADNGMIDVEIITGTGGMEQANDAMMESLGALGFSLVDNSKFVGGQANSHELVYGGYFNTYVHQDGHRVTFRKVPMMDRGIAADVSPRHPLYTNLPLESFNFYALDFSNYDGNPNMSYVQEEGRQNISFAVAGASTPQGYEETVYRASDIDACSIEKMKTHGVHIYRPTNCFKLECKIS